MGRRKIIRILGVILIIWAFGQHFGNSLAAEESQESCTEEEEPSLEEEEPSTEEEEEPPLEEEELPPEEEPLVRFQTEIPPPDGENGYYRSIPAIRIHHPGTIGITCYQLEDGSGNIVEGKLQEAGAQIVIEKELTEGRNILSVWMEDAQGNLLDTEPLKQELRLDTRPPALTLQVQNGWDHWYSQEAELQASVSDAESGSGIEKVVCTAGETFVGQSAAEESVFQIDQSSTEGRPVAVTVTVRDRAGNKTRRSCSLYIDSQRPEVDLQGVQNYQISKKPVDITCLTKDENLVKLAEGTIQWKGPDGKLTERMVEGWNGTDQEKRSGFTLTEDGSYRIRLTAADGAGHLAFVERYLLIDGTAPLIRHVEDLNGRFLKRFQWNYRTEELVEDGTSVHCDVFLDGQLYTMGTVVRREGRHVLEVKAVDAAGNETVARAEFLIDHTPPEIIFQQVEEGGCYEESREFRILLADRKDWIRSVRINGTAQSVDSKTSAYETAVQEEGNHEIQVEAVDLAGNVARESLNFAVTGKETIFEKVLGPVRDKRILAKSEEKEAELPVPAEEDKCAGKIAGLTGTAAAGITAGLLYWRRRKKGTLTEARRSGKYL